MNEAPTTPTQHSAAHAPTMREISLSESSGVAVDGREPALCVGLCGQKSRNCMGGS